MSKRNHKETVFDKKTVSDNSVQSPIVERKEYTAQEFAELYKKLCQNTGYQIAYEPRWAQSKDTGDYRLVIVSSVIPLPK